MLETSGVKAPAERTGVETLERTGAEIGKTGKMTSGKTGKMMSGMIGKLLGAKLCAEMSLLISCSTIDARVTAASIGGAEKKTWMISKSHLIGALKFGIASATDKHALGIA